MSFFTHQVFEEGKAERLEAVAEVREVLQPAEERLDLRQDDEEPGEQHHRHGCHWREEDGNLHRWCGRTNHNADRLRDLRVKHIDEPDLEEPRRVVRQPEHKVGNDTVDTGEEDLLLLGVMNVRRD